MTFTDHEKIATIYGSLWLRGIHHGEFGNAHWVNDELCDRDGLTQVDVKDGPSVLIWRDRRGLWCVSHNGIVGSDRDLETAARYALER
jgi:hypothetical protein